MNECEFQMNAQQLMDELKAWTREGAPFENDFSQTCDRRIYGEDKPTLSRVAVTMFATPQVIRAARDWNADLMIVHEPTFFDHMDKINEADEITQAKVRLLNTCGFSIWRFHDYPHYRNPDMIHEGAVRALGLNGYFEGGPHERYFHLDKPILPKTLLQLCKDKMGARHGRLCGNDQTPIQHISFALGACAYVMEDMQSPDIQAALVGENCEWQIAQYAMEAAQLGFSKSIFFLGHEASEVAGMKYFVEILKDKVCKAV